MTASNPGHLSAWAWSQGKGERAAVVGPQGGNEELVTEQGGDCAGVWKVDQLLESSHVSVPVTVTSLM